MSEQSESIKNLAAAMVKFQSGMKNVEKTSDNPFFHSKYADLTACMDAVRADLTANGLCVIQTNELAEHGLTVVTTLLHTSGEWIRGRVNLPLTKPDPQAAGATQTYGRRMGLTSITGLCPKSDDDDAQSAMPREQPHQPPPPHAPRVTQPAATAVPEERTTPPVQPYPGDWKEHCVHFGKNKDVPLKNLESKSLRWYRDMWNITPYQGSYTERDLMLWYAVNAWSDDLHAEKDEQPPAAADLLPDQQIPF